MDRYGLHGHPQRHRTTERGGPSEAADEVSLSCGAAGRQRRWRRRAAGAPARAGGGGGCDQSARHGRGVGPGARGRWRRPGATAALAGALLAAAAMGALRDRLALRRRGTIATVLRGVQSIRECCASVHELQCLGLCLRCGCPAGGRRGRHRARRLNECSLAH